MTLPLKRYFDFSGRSRRLEYWLFTVFVWAILIVEFMVIRAVTDALGAGGKNGDPPGAAFLIVFFTWAALFIPWLAALIRRLHDSDNPDSGCSLLFPSAAWSFWSSCSRWDGGPNSFGGNPKEEGAWHADVFA